jgi:hypothetical protein
MNVLAAVAQFERDLLIERTQAGLAGVGGRQEVRSARQSDQRSARRCAGGPRRRRERVGAGPPARDQPPDHPESAGRSRVAPLLPGPTRGRVGTGMLARCAGMRRRHGNCADPIAPGALGGPNGLWEPRDRPGRLTLEKSPGTGIVPARQHLSTGAPEHGWPGTL